MVIALLRVSESNRDGGEHWKVARTTKDEGEVAIRSGRGSSETSVWPPNGRGDENEGSLLWDSAVQRSEREIDWHRERGWVLLTSYVIRSELWRPLLPARAELLRRTAVVGVRESARCCSAAKRAGVCESAGVCIYQRASDGREGKWVKQLSRRTLSLFRISLGTGRTLFRRRFFTLSRVRSPDFDLSAIM